MSTERKCDVEGIPGLISRMRTLLLESQLDDKPSNKTDHDLELKELRMELSQMEVSSLELKQDALKALDEGHRRLLDEFLGNTLGSTAQRLFLNKTLDLLLSVAARILSDDDLHSQQYVDILEARVHTLENIMLHLLKEEKYDDLEETEKLLSEQLSTIRSIPSGKQQINHRKLGHAEAVLDMCTFEAKTHGGSSHDAALECLDRAKMTCEYFPELRRHLSLRAYCVGIECYRTRNYELAVSYLREAFAMMTSSVDTEHQAETLYLLGCAYLLWDKGEHWEKAVNALDMAIWHRPDALKQLTKKLEALTSSSDRTALNGTLDRILKHREMNTKSAIEVHCILKSNDLYEKSVEFLGQAHARLQDSPDAIRILVELLNTVLQASELDKAVEVFQKILDHSTEVTPEASEALDRLVRLLYEHGNTCGEFENVALAVCWLKNCEALMLRFDTVLPDKVSSGPRMADVRLSLAYWQVQLGALNEAKVTMETIKEEKENILLHYLLFKVAVMQGDESSAKEAAESLIALADSTNMLESEPVWRKASTAIIHICSTALEAGKSDLVKGVLQLFVSPPRRDPALAMTQLKCLQFITGLCVENFDENSLVYEEVVDSIQKVLAILHSWDKVTLVPEATSLVAWFAAIAWNLALQPEVSPYQQFQLFQCCASLFMTLESRAKHGSKRDEWLETYAAMAALSGVAAAQSVDDNEIKAAVLRDVQAIAVWYKQNNLDLQPTESSKFNSSLLIFQAELEAKIYSDAEDIMEALEQFLALPTVPTATLESLAHVCQDMGTRQAAAAIRLFQAVQQRYEEEPSDKTAIIRNFHNLFQVLLDFQRDEDLCQCIDRVTQSQLASSNDYPETELVWMMTKAWNTGLRWHMEENPQRAKRYMDCAIKLVKKLPVLRSAYEQHILPRYYNLYPMEASP